MHSFPNSSKLFLKSRTEVRVGKLLIRANCVISGIIIINIMRQMYVMINSFNWVQYNYMIFRVLSGGCKLISRTVFHIGIFFTVCFMTAAYRGKQSENDDAVTAKDKVRFTKVKKMFLDVFRNGSQSRHSHTFISGS